MWSWLSTWPPLPNCWAHFMLITLELSTKFRENVHNMWEDLITYYSAKWVFQKDLCWNHIAKTVINLLDKQPNFRWTIFQCPFSIFRCIDIVKFVKFRWHSTLLPCYHTPNYATITVFWDWPVKLRFFLMLYCIPFTSSNVPFSRYDIVHCLCCI